VLSIVHHPTVAVNIQMETVNTRLPIAEAVAHKELGGDNQLFPHQYFFKLLLESCFLKGMQ
jgi:hypothetical protein